MFGIGLPELILIAIAVLVFVKPKDLPNLGRKIGRLIREMKSMREEFLKNFTDSGMRK
jgi:Sec-independent protein translocase protein TatA